MDKDDKEKASVYKVDAQNDGADVPKAEPVAKAAVTP